MLKNIIISIDLAGKATNPTGWAMLRNKTISTCHLLHPDKEILDNSINCNPKIIAVDAPLNMLKKAFMRKADKERQKRGYHVFPPRFPAMEKLTLRAIRIAKELTKRQLKVIEVHPTSTRIALKIPTKDWGKIHTIFLRIGLEGNLKTRLLTPHEIDAVTAALTGHLYIQGKTELIGDRKEGSIIVPSESDWRKLQL
jgi:predicted nuclease with RNAse H fold